MKEESGGAGTIVLSSRLLSVAEERTSITEKAEAGTADPGDTKSSL